MDTLSGLTIDFDHTKLMGEGKAVYERNIKLFTSASEKAKNDLEIAQALQKMQEILELCDQNQVGQTEMNAALENFYLIVYKDRDAQGDATLEKNSMANTTDGEANLRVSPFPKPGDAVKRS